MARQDLLQSLCIVCQEQPKEMGKFDISRYGIKANKQEIQK